MLEKIAGVISLLLGILIVIFFPDISKYQAEGIAVGGVIVGLGLIALGIYLLKT